MTETPWRRDAQNADDANNPTTTETDQPTSVAIDIAPDDLLDSLGVPVIPGHSDCCIAAAAYEAVLPASATRQRPTTLFLCGHHYRAASRSLASANATVFDLHHVLVAAPSTAIDP